MTFIEYVKSGQAVDATRLLESALKRKTLGFIKESRSAVAEAVYGTLDEEELDEAEKGPHPLHHYATKHGYKYTGPGITTNAGEPGAVTRHNYEHPTGAKLELGSVAAYPKGHYKTNKKDSGNEHHFWRHETKSGKVMNHGMTAELDPKKLKYSLNRHLTKLHKRNVNEEADWKKTQARDWHNIAQKHGYKKVGDTEHKMEYGATTQDFTTHKLTPGRAIGNSTKDTYEHPNGHKLTITNHPSYGKQWNHEPKGSDYKTKTWGKEHKKLERTLSGSGGVKESIEKPNSSGQGHDPDHVNNPHHATILKHGYEYSHSTPVNHSPYSVGPSNPEYKNQDIRIYHAYKHRDLKDHVVGVYPTKNGGHKWDVHKLGQSGSFAGSGDAALDKHLKGHVARAKKAQGAK